MLILLSKNGRFWIKPLISSQGMMVEKQTIPHLNALMCGSNILREQPCCSFRGSHATLLFTNVPLPQWTHLPIQIPNIVHQVKKWHIQCEIWLQILSACSSWLGIFLLPVLSWQLFLWINQFEYQGVAILDVAAISRLAPKELTACKIHIVFFKVNRRNQLLFAVLELSAK